MSPIEQIAKQLQIPFEGRDDGWLLSAINMKLSIVLPLITTADGKVLTTEDTIYTPDEMHFTKSVYFEHGKMITEFDHDHQPYDHPTSDICVMHSHEWSTPLSECYFDLDETIEAAKRQYEERRADAIKYDEDETEYTFRSCRG